MKRLRTSRLVGSLLGGAALLGLSLSAPSAHAAPAESPQFLMFEVKFGPYVPHLDSSASVGGRTGPTMAQPYLPSPTPFSDYFGNSDSPKGDVPARRLLGEGEIDYQFFHRFGVLGIGLSGGYTSISAPAFSASGSAMGGSSYCRVREENKARVYYRPTDPIKTLSYQDCISGDETTFNLVPVALMLVYRFDVLSKRFRIPLIPYVKVGLGCYIWWVSSSGSFTTELTTSYTDDQGRPQQATSTASGASAGLVVRPGIAIDLSAIDWLAARAIDQEIGLNRVTAFVEFNGSFVNGFGAANKLDLSDTSLSAGLGFEF
jgi:hypothetical protein